MTQQEKYLLIAVAVIVAYFLLFKKKSTTQMTAPSPSIQPSAGMTPAQIADYRRRLKEEEGR